MLADQATIWTDILSSITTVIVALIAAGFFRYRVMLPLKKIEAAVNNIKEGEPTLIDRVNNLGEEAQNSKKLFVNYQQWVIQSLHLIAKQVGIQIPTYKEK